MKNTHLNWVLASRNAGKIKEFQAWAQTLGITLISATDLALPEIEELYFTFVENALHKARMVSKMTGKPSFSDDSGICIPALQGKPGVFSARFAGEPANDARNNQALLEAMKEVIDRRAYYYAVLVLCEHEHDPQPCIAQGQWWGHILKEPEGKNGFGYDPLFWDETLGKSAASLTPEEKSQCSHRGKALRHLEQQLIERYNLNCI